MTSKFPALRDEAPRATEGACPDLPDDQENWSHDNSEQFGTPYSLRSKGPTPRLSDKPLMPVTFPRAKLPGQLAGRLPGSGAAGCTKSFFRAGRATREAYRPPSQPNRPASRNFETGPAHRAAHQPAATPLKRSALRRTTGCRCCNDARQQIRCTGKEPPFHQRRYRCAGPCGGELESLRARQGFQRLTRCLSLKTPPQNSSGDPRGTQTSAIAVVGIAQNLMADLILVNA